MLLIEIGPLSEDPASITGVQVVVQVNLDSIVMGVRSDLFAAQFDMFALERLGGSPVYIPVIRLDHAPGHFQEVRQA